MATGQSEDYFEILEPIAISEVEDETDIQEKSEEVSTFKNTFETQEQIGAVPKIKNDLEVQQPGTVSSFNGNFETGEPGAESQFNDDFETQDSEEIRDMFCENCDNDGKHAVAEGYCVDCNEFMCTVCFRYHHKYSPNHVTQNKDQMPQDYCFEKCSAHSDKCIKYYCPECNKFACSICVSNKRKSHEFDCKSKIWLPIHAVVQNTEKRSKTDDSLSEITSEIKRIEEKAIKMDQNWLKFNEQVRKSIASHKKAIEQRINDLERQFQVKLDENKHTFTAFLNPILKEVAGVKSQNDLTLSDRTKVQHSHNRCLKFIVEKRIERSIRSAADKLQSISRKMTYKAYDFEAADFPVKDRKDFGSFVFKESKQKQRAVYEYDIDVATYFKYIIPGSISDMCVQGDYLVAVVYLCSTIVLVNHKDKQIKSKITISGNPARATFIGDRQLAVTLPKKGKILLYSIIDDNAFQKQQKEIRVEEGCCGITYSKNQGHIFVSYLAPKSKITVITMTGTIAREFDRDVLDNKMFIRPENIVLTSDEKSLYVSDIEKNMVVKIDLDGKIEAVFKDENLKGPFGIALDENESVYVCGKSSKNVFQLASNLSKVCEIVDCAQAPVSITTCCLTKYVYIGMLTDTKIKCFARSNEET